MPPGSGVERAGFDMRCREQNSYVSRTKSHRLLWPGMVLALTFLPALVGAAGLATAVPLPRSGRTVQVPSLRAAMPGLVCGRLLHGPVESVRSWPVAPL
ncbi:hypothetical protein SAMN04489712_11231 [Thermomonospora echinospora]|uniref:Uncharacterized protein n=1 Tax=Thermomonospora echinospora TaxID=1992 RepID=A0A1H6CY63_9ACTN|nr:hypothetical protein SAMN04489712_11231 [Thermomonospora echinospora]